MRKALGILAVLVAFQALLVIVYVGFQRGRDGVAVPVDRPDRPAPDLVLQSVDGTESRISDLQGSTVVLHFWATWCPPCREELPSLFRFASSGAAEVVAVSVDPEWSAVRSFVDDSSLEYVYLASSEAVSDTFKVEGLPQTFVIDPDGGLRLHFRGSLDWGSRAVRKMIDELDER